MLAFFSLIFTACGGDSSKESDSVYGYAPKDLQNKTLILKNKDGSILLDNRHFFSEVSVNNVTVDYVKYPPSYSYTATSYNHATYIFNATKKTYIPYYGSYHYSKFSFLVYLSFTSENGGSYTGTQTNADGKKKNITGTFTLN